MPGPGTYSNSSLPYLIKSSFNKGKYSKQFGSGSKRFTGDAALVKSEAELVPGPG